MLEPLVRSSLPHLQNLYERFPSPARHALVSARGWLLTRIRYSPATFAALRELRSHESWSPRQIAAHQFRALRRTLDHALATVPFYAGYARFEIRELEDLRRFPILTREALLQNHDQMLSKSTLRHRRIRASTTGTTGASLRVAYTEEFASQNWAFLLRQWAWAGITSRQPRLTLQGARVVPANRRKPPFWAYNLPEQQILLSIFHLSERAAPAYLDLLQQHRGESLEGFPSALAILADFVLGRGAPVPMRVVFTSGEPLGPGARAKIEAAFQTRVFDTYGMTEYCGLIQECERGRMHLAPEFGFLEILREDGEPAAPGEEGFFVWTGFLNNAMPLIRYRIGDRGRWQDTGPCPCGRAFPLVLPTITRESDILRCPDGRLFSPRALNQLLKQAGSLRFCQFVHDRPDRVVIRAGLRNGHASEEVRQISARLQQLLGADMQVAAEFAEAPITRPGGKIPLIVNQVQP